MAKKKIENIVDEVQEIKKSNDDDEIFSIIKSIKKQFPDGSQTHHETATSFLTSGNLGINYAVSGRADGGFPEGLVTEIFGDHSSGKSLIAYHTLVQTQQKGGVAILIDTERAFNQHWFNTIGGDNNKLIYQEMDTMEEVFTYMEKIIPLVVKNRIKHPNTPITIVWDSLAQTSTKAELEADMEKSEMAMRARKSGQGFRKVLGPLKDNRISLIVINQIRSNIGVMYGPDVDTVGGKALKFAASVRMEVKKGKVILDSKKKEVGIGGRVKVAKNRCRAPFATSEFSIYWKEGIDPVSGYFKVCKDDGIITQPSVGWWSYEGEKFREKDFPAFLLKHPSLLGDMKVNLDKFSQYQNDDTFEGEDSSVNSEEADATEEMEI